MKHQHAFRIKKDTGKGPVLHFPKINQMLYMLIVCALIVYMVLSRGIGGEYQALEQLRVAGALGCDRSGDGIVLSASVKTPGEDAPPLRLLAEGSGIRTALDGLERQLPEGELVFSHVLYALVGQDFARENVEPLLRYAERDRSLRLGVGLFLTDRRAADPVALGRTPAAGSARRLWSAGRATARPRMAETPVPAK